MASFNFGLLELADGESGDAAVSIVVSKTKAEAAAAHAKKAAADASAKKAEAAAARAKKAAAAADSLATGTEEEKAQLDYGVSSIEPELKRLRAILTKLRLDETKLKEIGADGRYLIKLSEEQRDIRLMQLAEEQRKLRQQQRKLREQEHSYRNGEPDVHDDGAYVYHERQVEEGYAHNDNGSRQGYPEVHNKRKVQKYVVKGQRPPSDAGTDADRRPEHNITSDAASEGEHKPVGNGKEEAGTPANTDAAAASGSDNSSAAGAGNSGQDGPKHKFVKERLSGSMKRKKKNAKKNGGNGVDKAEKTDNEPQASHPKEEEKKTLAEYEKIREEKKKSLEDVSRTEHRKVSAEEFKGLQILETKKLDDEEAVLKAEKVQTKAKESGKKEEKVQPEARDAVKPKKGVTSIPLKDLSFAPPTRRNVLTEDGSSYGGGAPRGRFNGGSFQGRNRDSSSDSRTPTGRGGDNGRAAQNEAGNYGNGAPRGGYSGGRGYGAPRGDYSGGRGDGGYGAPRGNHSGGRGYGAQGGSYSGRGNGGGGGYHGNGGYHNQGGNGGGYHQQQQQQGQGGYQRRPGNDNYYRPRGPAPAPEAEDMKVFPPLPASAPSRAAAPAAAPMAAPAPASAQS